MGSVARYLYRTVARKPRFTDSSTYWRSRYAAGGDSGAGSYGRFAAFKAEVLNCFARDHRITRVIEFGCGDGHQLSFGAYPSYIGVDVSEDAIRRCRAAFKGDSSKRFMLADEYTGQTSELAISLDVIYHLVEDDVFHQYMTRLFDAAERYVVIYSSDTDQIPNDRDLHVRHRQFSRWIDTHRPDWVRIAHIPNRFPYSDNPLTGSFADFHIYARRD
jgi:hypothetical protein